MEHQSPLSLFLAVGPLPFVEGAVALRELAVSMKATMAQLPFVRRTGFVIVGTDQQRAFSVWHSAGIHIAGILTKETAKGRFDLLALNT